MPSSDLSSDSSNSLNSNNNKEVSATVEAVFTPTLTLEVTEVEPVEILDVAFQQYDSNPFEVEDTFPYSDTYYSAVDPEITSTSSSSSGSTSSLSSSS
jgi:hypothetical protein